MARPNHIFSDEKFQFLFWTKVDVQPGKCWLWLKGLESNGYGQQTISGKNYLSHRVSYAMANSLNLDEIPKDVLHRCNVKRCVNPAHLYLGDDKQNAKDRIEAGSQVSFKGEANAMAKFVDSDILFI